MQLQGTVLRSTFKKGLGLVCRMELLGEEPIYPPKCETHTGQVLKVGVHAVEDFWVCRSVLTVCRSTVG